MSQTLKNIGSFEFFVEEGYKFSAAFFIERPKVTEKIQTIINGQEKLVALVGKAAVGKSTQVAHYIRHQSNLLLGEYIYFSSVQILLEKYKSLLKVECLKFIIVDQVSGCNKEFLAAIKEIEKSNKRLILISNTELDEIKKYTIPLLSQEEIMTYLKDHNKLEHIIDINGKQFNVCEIVKSKIGGLYARMRYPQGLIQLCEHAKLPEMAANFSAIASPYHQHAPTAFKPIALRAERVLPLYTIDELIKLNEFQGSKCIAYQKKAALIKFKKQYVSAAEEIWVDLESLGIPEDPNIKINLKQLLLNSLNDKQKTRFQNGKSTLVLVDKNAVFKSWSEARKNTLLSINNIIFLTNEVCGEAQHNFALNNQNQTYYLEYKTDSPFNLPLSSLYINHPIDLSIQQALQQDQSKITSALITAVGGAGKSTSLKMLYNNYLQSNELSWAERYHHLVYLPLSRLVNLNLTDLFAVMLYFLNIPIVAEQIKQALKEDLTKNRVLFLLDGWDEINKAERKKIKPLLKDFASYQHFIMTTRPITNLEQLFFQPAAIYNLQKLQPIQIKKFLTSFFRSEQHSELAKQFVEQGILYLNKTENKQALEMLGLPLQCYLLCEAWQPDFEALCGGKTKALPWETTPVLSRVKLYQLFLKSRLRKALFDQYAINREGVLASAEEICTLGTRHISLLQQAAYQQLFRGKPLQLGNDWFANQINRLGLIENAEFVHKTYAEYFAALYLVNLLRTDAETAKALIFEYRYQAHFCLVFEFAAGIVSYGDPAISEAKFYLRSFWEALLQEPRDRISLLEKDLIKACCLSSHKSTLETIFDAKDLSEIISLSSSHTANQKSSTVALTLDTNQQQSEIVKFKQPVYIEDYKTYAINILALPVDKYDAKEKKKALDWLLSRIKTTRSFRVKEACADRLGILGIASNEVIRILIELLKQKENDTRSSEKEYAVKALIELELNSIWWNLDSASFSEVIKVIKGFLTHDLSSKSLDWLGKQDLSDEQLDILFEELKSANFRVQRAVVSTLAKSLGSDFFVKTKAKIKALANVGLTACLDYERALLKPKIFPQYLTWLCKLEYDATSFNIIVGMLNPIRKLLENEEVDASDKQQWLDKIYNFALEAIIAHSYKDSISHLVIELVHLNIAPEKMQTLLADFLSQQADYGYWGFDAVQPCLPYLLAYFNQTIADYLYYKTCEAKCDLPIYELISPKHLQFLPDNDEARKNMVKLCLKIYQKGKKNKNKEFITQCIREFTPDLVCPIIIAELNAVTVEILKTYLTSSNYAMTLSEEQLCIYTSAGLEKIAVNATQRELLKSIFPAKIFSLLEVAPIQERPPSPPSFLLAYPGTLFNFASPPNDEQTVGVSPRIFNP